MSCRLSKRYDEASFTERHSPFSRFRNRVAKLEDRARALLNDTLVEFLIQFSVYLNLMISIVHQKTTVPFVDDIDFDEIPSPTGTDIFFTPPASPDVDGRLPWLHNIFA